MADPLLTVDVDDADLLAALGQLGDRADLICHEEAIETGEIIVREARARVRVATGTMRDAITMEVADGPLRGVRVFVAPMADPAGRWGGGLRPANLPLWHEDGTKKMEAQPFLLISGRLEEGAHLRRVAEAIQQAIDEQGLSDG